MRSATHPAIDWTLHVSDDLLDRVRATRLGASWERRLRQHDHEIEALAAVHPQVRAHLVGALEHLTIAWDQGLVTEATLDAVLLALDDLVGRGDVGLSRTAGALREEAILMRGRDLAEVLHP